MNEPFDGLVKHYTSVLQDYLAGEGESGLYRAYELGRKAIADGLGVVQVMTIHQEALVKILLRAITPEESARVAKRATEFFAETLASFEMTHRGFQEANATLRLMNQELEGRAAALVALNNELEAFSYAVAHDLKAPLRGMEGFARALLEDYAERLDETGRHYLDMIRGSARRMGALIDDLLQYSRVERRAMRWERVDLERLVRDVLAERQPEIEGRGVRIEMTLPFREIAGEREGLRQALANLLDNALKFTRKVDQPAITIRGTEGEAERVLSVSDDGVGFDPKYSEKAFAMFQRLHSQEEYEGTGIGLAIVKKVAERHGGRAWAISELGKGSTFYLAIPHPISDCRLQIEKKRGR